MHDIFRVVRKELRSEKTVIMLATRVSQRISQSIPVYEDLKKCNATMCIETQHKRLQYIFEILIIQYYLVIEIKQDVNWYNM